MAGTSEIHDATLTPGKLDLLQAWLPAQRWYVGKDHEPVLERVGAYRFEDPAGEVGIETHLVRDTAAQPPVLYQVPVTYRAAALPDAEDALVGTTEHSVLGTRYVYDATHDPAYVAELVRTLVEGDTESTPSRGAHDTHVVGEPVDGAPRPVVEQTQVLSGEQSNTSMIVDATVDGVRKPFIVKVFRVLHPGDNPDVTVQSALAAAGSRLVPAPLAALRGTWGGGITGHLAFAQEFLPGVQDAWRVALAAIADGTDFTERARALGHATGEMHRDLASAMETKEAGQVDKDAVLASMRTRYVLAAEAHPELRRDEEAILRVLTAAQDVEWPTLQRIHGDYHLGQVLDVPGRGWVLLDFEGEPLRPLNERSLPDLPHRDVAGMLRSFDYAAGQHAHNGGSTRDGRRWAEAARRAFLDGYSETYGTDPRATSPALLAALELDKALYEVVYEARNRPDWLAIPTSAVSRLVGSTPRPAAAQGQDQGQAQASTTPDPADLPSLTPTTATTPVPQAAVEAARPAVDLTPDPTDEGSLDATPRPTSTQEGHPVTDPTPRPQPTPSPETPEQAQPAVHDAKGTSGVAETLRAAASSAAGAVTSVVASATSAVADATISASNAVADAAATAASPATAPDEAPDGPDTDGTTGGASATPAAPARRTPGPVAVSTDELNRLIAGHHHDPHSILGPHPGPDGVTVRVLAPSAKVVRLHLEGGRTADLAHEHNGVWVGLVDGDHVPDYRVGIDYGDGFEHTTGDAYRFLPTIGEVDLHLIGEGRHERLWDVLGSHVRSYSGPLGETRGTSFAVWAPNAVAVRVSGDFNHWDSARHPMRSMGSSGVWELFVPGVDAGTRYKYEICTKDGRWIAKADPLARRTEIPPATASVVTDSDYAWGDADWVTARDARSAHQSPMAVYEVHLGSWRQGLSYTELADQLVGYVKDLGFTHVEFLPVAEHPYGPSWGYQVTGYYAPTARFGTPDEFRHLVDELHKAGIGVILDWVPAHFPKDAFALAKFDGEALYEHPDPRRGDQPDWGTHVFDFGRPQVRNFLVANALYWLEEFHIDGLRVDAVASMLYLDYSRKDGEWLPNQFGGREHLEAVQFLQETNATVYKHHPGVLMIAEESTSWPGVTRPTHVGGLGFGFKWNMGWMHDSLEYVEHEPVHRQYHHHQMTFGMVYAYSENFVLPISHDEVVYGKGSLLRKMPGDRWQQLANLRSYLAFMWSHPGKQLLFMGQEFAQEAEWADGQSLDWWLLDQPWHLSVHQMIKQMNAVYQASPALWQLDNDPAGFQWIDANDAQGNVFSFMRYGAPDENGAPALAVVSNFSPVPHHQYRIGLPEGGTWREVLNTDAQEWAGSGVGNGGTVHAEEIPWHGMPYSAAVVVPPLGTIWLAPADGTVRREKRVEHQDRPELAAAAQAQAEADVAADAADRPELTEGRDDA